MLFRSPEFIHYRSGDGWLNLLTLIFWPFCWFNPFFIAARKHLRFNCELACDAEVLKRYPDRIVDYGKLLLEFAGTARPPEVTMAFREYANELRSRIIYMAELPRRRKSSWLVTFGLALVLAAPFGLVSAIVRDEVPRQSAPAEAPAAVVKKSTCCCSATLLIPLYCPEHRAKLPPLLPEAENKEDL